MLGEYLLQINRGGPGGAMRGAPLGLAINLVSTGLLLALVMLWFSTWRRTKAPFTLGLLLFAGALLLGSLARVGASMGYVPFNIVVIPDILEVAALAVLLYLATR